MRIVHHFRGLRLQFACPDILRGCESNLVAPIQHLIWHNPPHRLPEDVLAAAGFINQIFCRKTDYELGKIVGQERHSALDGKPHGVAIFVAQ